MASLLLEQEGIDVDISDAFGDTALHYAAANGARQRHKNYFPDRCFYANFLLFFSGKARKYHFIAIQIRFMSRFFSLKMRGKIRKKT